MSTAQNIQAGTQAHRAPLSRWMMPLAAATAVGAVGCVGGWLAFGVEELLHSYLTAFVFVVSLPLGLLFFVMLHHVTDSSWSVVVRRPAEQCLAALPVLGVLLIPVLVGTAGGKLFAWARNDPADVLLHAKAPFLNLPFFMGRAVLYFGVWLVLSNIFRRRSLGQDVTGDAGASVSMRRWAGPGLIAYALTFTFAVIDWVMTLDHAWFSTIFGVYVWSGAVVAGLCVLILLALSLHRVGLPLTEAHVHDLGKLLFAFSVFWAYIAFSQYFLIWYANIPEETVWFLHRWHGGWKAVSIALPAGRFVVPFFLLMSVVTKRQPKVLAGASVFLLLMHYVDVYWMVQPVLHAKGPTLSRLWMDVCAVMLIGGAGAWAVARAMSRGAIYPLRDPRLEESLHGDHGHDHGDEASAAAAH